MWCVTQVKNHTQHEMLMFDIETCRECKTHCAQACGAEALLHSEAIRNFSVKLSACFCSIFFVGVCICLCIFSRV